MENRQVALGNRFAEPRAICELRKSKLTKPDKTKRLVWRAALSFDSPRVESFVLRFVQDTSIDGAVSTRQWHAVVVHVQTNEEKTFTDFADAVAFISRYVPLGELHFKDKG